MELIGQGLDAIAVPGQPRLKVIELSREDGLDNVGGDGFFAAAEAVLEGQGQVLLDLQRVHSRSASNAIAASSMMEV